MVYTLAQNDGLGIRVESEPGQGTAFSIVIPASEASRTREPMTRE
jgi:signal transduction histidine kinase